MYTLIWQQQCNAQPATDNFHIHTRPTISGIDAHTANLEFIDREVIVNDSPFSLYRSTDRRHHQLLFRCGENSDEKSVDDIGEGIKFLTVGRNLIDIHRQFAGAEYYSALTNYDSTEYADHELVNDGSQADDSMVDSGQADSGQADTNKTTINDLDNDTLRLVIAAAGEHFAARVCSRWRKIALKKIRRDIVRRRRVWDDYNALYHDAIFSRGWFNLRHADFIEAVADPDTSDSAISIMVWKYVTKDGGRDRKATASVSRILKKCIIRMNGRDYGQPTIPAKMLQLLDATIKWHPYIFQTIESLHDSIGATAHKLTSRLTRPVEERNPIEMIAAVIMAYEAMGKKGGKKVIKHLILAKVDSAIIDIISVLAKTWYGSYNYWLDCFMENQERSMRTYAPNCAGFICDWTQ